MEYSNKLLLKGNEAVVYGALLAGCDCFFGYPITPPVKSRRPRRRNSRCWAVRSSRRSARPLPLTWSWGPLQPAAAP